MFRKIINSNQGIAMIQIMVMGAIANALFVFLLSKQKASQEIAYTQIGTMEILNDLKLIDKFLADSENCETSFRDANILYQGEGNISSLQTKTGIIAFKPTTGITAGRRSRILSMRSQNENISLGGSGQLSLIVDFFRKSEKRIIRKKISVDATINLIGGIVTCRSHYTGVTLSNLRKTFCEDLGAKYDTGVEECSFKGVDLVAFEDLECTTQRLALHRYNSISGKIENCSPSLAWEAI